MPPWIILLIFVSLFSPTFGCMCMPSHPQSHVCNSDFVLKVRVTKDIVVNSTTVRLYENQVDTSITPTWRVFHIKVLEELKVGLRYEKALQQSKRPLLYTSVHESMCGVRIEPGKYLVSGLVDEKQRLRISICDLARTWSLIGKPQRRALILKTYEKNCNCKVRTCYKPGCRNHKSASSCSWEQSTSNSKLGGSRYDLCQEDFAHCKVSENNLCQWSKSKALKECLARTEP